MSTSYLLSCARQTSELSERARLVAYDERLLRWWRIPESPLEPRYVVPLPELATNPFKSADEFETRTAMQCDASLVGQSDARVRVAEASFIQIGQQV